MQVYLVISVYNGVIDRVEGFLDDMEAQKFEWELKEDHRKAGLTSKVDIVRRDIEVS